jgi:hypothetical protein
MTSTDIIVKAYRENIPFSLRKLMVGKSIEEIVKTCENGDELLHLAEGICLPFERKIVLAKALCAKTVIHLMIEPDSIKAVNIAEKFGLNNDVELYRLRNAYNEAFLAWRRVALLYRKYDTALAELYATDCACKSCEYNLFFDDHAIAVGSSYAIDYYVNAAAYAIGDYATAEANPYAKIKNQKETADICREIFGKELIEAVNNILKN